MSSTIYSGPGTSGRRAGVVAVTIDGEAVDVAGDCTYDPTTVKRETQVGQSGVQGYSEMPKQGIIAFNLRDANSLTVQSLNNKTSSSIVVLLANGKTVSGDGMWTTDVEAVNTQDATFKVTFEGRSVVETTA